MVTQHNYTLTVQWTGNKGSGTSNYQSYSRDHIISTNNKPPIPGSSDPAFRGDITKHNPEDLFVASLSSCHMLWYLHLCSQSGIIVIEYIDHAKGIMIENEDGSGQFIEVSLYPSVVVEHSSMILKANELHTQANKNCFIANSCNFPIKHFANCTSK